MLPPESEGVLIPHSSPITIEKKVKGNTGATSRLLNIGEYIFRSSLRSHGCDFHQSPGQNHHLPNPRCIDMRVEERVDISL